MRGATREEEKLIQELETCANFCRGMTLDPSIPKHAKEALTERYKAIEALTESTLRLLGLK